MSPFVLSVFIHELTVYAPNAAFIEGLNNFDVRLKLQVTGPSDFRLCLQPLCGTNHTTGGHGCYGLKLRTSEVVELAHGELQCV